MNDVMNKRTAGIISGIGYIALFVLAIFANFMVKEGMIVSGNAIATAENMLNGLPVFRAGMVSFLIIFLIDVFVAWGLHVLFRENNHDLSLLAAWFRIVYTVFLGVAIVFYFQAIQLLGFGSSFYEQLMVSLESFNSVWLIGLAAFGVHVILLGAMIVKYKMAPRILGYILILSGIAYMLDTVVHTMVPDYSQIAGIMTVIVAVPAIIGEGWFGIWLLVKGGKSA